MTSSGEAINFPEGARWEIYKPYDTNARGSMKFLGGNAV